jgi:hypothetical protein
MRSRPLALVAAIGAAALAVAGCGVGEGDSQGGLQLSVTQDFGTNTMIDTSSPKTGGSDTVMRLLERNADVKTRYGGGFVQSIDGKAGGKQGGRPYDWFFFVNGVLADQGAAAIKVHEQDTIWWDRHDWGVTDHTPAVVGSFPEPFTHGIDGRKLPIRVECVHPEAKVCDAVQAKLTAVGVLAPKAGLETSLTKQTLRVLVGTYKDLRADDTAHLLEQGPKASGVYAKPAPSGKTIQVLDGQGKPTRTLGPGSGLIAATRYEGGQPVWIVTGTDDAGVSAAADAIDEGNLKNHFALAVSDDRAVSVPEVRGAP